MAVSLGKLKAFCRCQILAAVKRITYQLIFHPAADIIEPTCVRQGKRRRSAAYGKAEMNFIGVYGMKVKEIAEILKADILNEGDMEQEVKTACGSDMMSDVLAFVKDQSVLLTGLMNPQVIRTAEMMDMHCVVFVRGKQGDASVIDLAREKNITLLASPYRMFTACGLLYSSGLRGGCDIS